jgi:hypothetical protein
MQVRAMLLAPTIQRFPLDIPPGRKQDDDRAQHRNGRKAVRFELQRAGFEVAADDREQTGLGEGGGGDVVEYLN